MDFQQLTNQLYDPDPRKRIEALRILAMVEETRAINAILLVYKNDPDEGVRAVAKWAGSLIWQAKERGHTTEAALEAYFKGARVAELEEIMVDRLILSAEENPELKNKLEIARTQWEQVESIKAAKSQTQAMQEIEKSLADDLDLLDAGLSDLK